MTSIMLNGERHELGTTLSVRALLDVAGYGERKVAVEINREIVPRSEHATRLLRDGDHVEVVNAIGGG